MIEKHCKKEAEKNLPENFQIWSSYWILLIITEVCSGHFKMNLTSEKQGDYEIWVT